MQGKLIKVLSNFDANCTFIGGDGEEHFYKLQKFTVDVPVDGHNSQINHWSTFLISRLHTFKEFRVEQVINCQALVPSPASLNLIPIQNPKHSFLNDHKTDGTDLHTPYWCTQSCHRKPALLRGEQSKPRKMTPSLSSKAREVSLSPYPLLVHTKLPQKTSTFER